MNRDLGIGQSARQCYTTVINKVIENCRDAFLDEGLDEHTLQELKQIWIEKLKQSKVLQPDKQRPVRYAYSTPVVSNQQAQQRQVQMQTTRSPGQYQQNNQRVRGYQIVQQRPNAVGVTNQVIHYQQQGQQPQTQQRVYVQQRPHPNQAEQPRIVRHQIRHQQPNRQSVQRQVPGQMQGQRVILRLAPGQPQSRNIQQVIRAGPPQQQQRQRQYVQNYVQVQGEPVDEYDDEHVHHENIEQYDGHADLSSGSELSSSSDDELDSDDPNAVDEPPITEGDDVSSEEGPDEAFETDNVIICQYEKVTRVKNKWKIFLKDGIMSCNGKDFVFNRASGDTDW